MTNMTNMNNNKNKDFESFFVENFDYINDLRELSKKCISSLEILNQGFLSLLNIISSTEEQGTLNYFIKQRDRENIADYLRLYFHKKILRLFDDVNNMLIVNKNLDKKHILEIKEVLHYTCKKYDIKLN